MLFRSYTCDVECPFFFFSERKKKEILLRGAVLNTSDGPNCRGEGKRKRESEPRREKKKKELLARKREGGYTR